MRKSHKKHVQPKVIKEENVDGRRLKSGWPVKVVSFSHYSLFTCFLGACQMVQDCVDQEYPNSTSKLEWHHLSSIWFSSLICFPHFCLWHISLNIGRNVHWFFLCFLQSGALLDISSKLEMVQDMSKVRMKSAQQAVMIGTIIQMIQSRCNLAGWTTEHIIDQYRSCTTVLCIYPFTDVFRLLWRNKIPYGPVR